MMPMVEAGLTALRPRLRKLKKRSIRSQLSLRISLEAGPAELKKSLMVYSLATALVVETGLTALSHRLRKLRKRLIRSQLSLRISLEAGPAELKKSLMAWPFSMTPVVEVGLTALRLRLRKLRLRSIRSQLSLRTSLEAGPAELRKSLTMDSLTTMAMTGVGILGPRRPRPESTTALIVTLTWKRIAL
jgi:hypothetical protein